MIVTLYGKRGNKWTQRVLRALIEKNVPYTFDDEFDWARDENCKTLACHINEDGLALIQKMPTIHLEGDMNEIAHWLLRGDFKQQNPVTMWHYIGQQDEYWIVGLDDCIDFVQGAAWPAV
jgi:hypothetical protein